MFLISPPRIFKDQGSGYLLRVSKGTLKWTGPVKLLSIGQLGSNLKSILVLTLVHNRSSWKSTLDPSPLLLFIETYIQGKTFYTILLLSPSRIQLEWHSKNPARPRPPCPGCLLSSSWSPPAVQPLCSMCNYWQPCTLCRVAVFPDGSDLMNTSWISDFLVARGYKWVIS